MNKSDFLEGPLLPQIKFMSEHYVFTLAHYHFATQFIKNKIVLDGGCGAGTGSMILQKAGAKKIHGIDIWPSVIEYCHKYHNKQNIIFQIGDVTALDFPNNFFDVICAFEVIEHLKEPPKAIGEFYRTLKPGGILLVSTPNKTVYSPDSKKPFHPSHFYEFHLDELKKLLQPFKIRKILGEYIKGKEIKIYHQWHPKRLIRKIYAILPIIIKKIILIMFIKIYFWKTKFKIFRTKQFKFSDVYFSNNLDKTMNFFVICQK